MHLLRTTARLLEEQENAVDLGQSPADIVFLSFSDSDLGLAAAVCEDRYSARLASLAMLKHPYSVDLHIGSVSAKARFVLVRLLGGLDYWRYGTEQLADAARAHGFDLAIVPGDHREDPRLDELSTLPQAMLRTIWAHFQAGSAENLSQLFGWIDGRVSGVRDDLLKPVDTPSCGYFRQACLQRLDGNPSVAAIVLYRSHVVSADTAPIQALADALAQRGFRVIALFVASLKEPASAAFVRDVFKTEQPDIVLNTTAFSSRINDTNSPLDIADAPVFQVILAGSSQESWRTNARGLNAADLAMNVVLPEIDGRLITRAISFKAETAPSEVLEFTRLIHCPLPSRIDFVADLALNWTRLRTTPRFKRRLACILSDYPAKGGREGYAVGLDTPNSVVSITGLLQQAGYDIDPVTNPARLIQDLATAAPAISLDNYRRYFALLPASVREAIHQAWGEPESDPSLRDGSFPFRFIRCSKLIVALQPDRGRLETRKLDYHNADLYPRHAYVAFYLWLRHIERFDAVIHLGTHGTLEWLPGKSVALDDRCVPEVLLGPMPLIYPFIVNNPGEAAQAKRRSAAVTIGHLTPPLTLAGSYGALLDLEELFDEYAAAENLDPKRAGIIAQTILDRALETGIAQESGIAAIGDGQVALAKLDGWLCDIKDLRIGDGLHVFGQAPMPGQSGVLDGFDTDAGARARLHSCPDQERDGLLAALDGKFVAPGPAGAPSRGRLDVLPTGRNLFTIDPRMIPTRTAWETGRRAASAIIARYLQDHGEWPKRIIMDLWGSATMRTGGEEFAQALALLGLSPIRDQGSARVTGFKILPPAVLEGPRVDVTLRISGLFRDVFPAQIALFDQAVREVAALDEAPEINPLAGTMTPLRIFGAAPGSYGVGVSRDLTADGMAARDSLGAAYLAATSYAHGIDTTQESGEFRDRVASADAFVHVQDIAGQDVLDSDAFAEHEGGFSAAASSLGVSPALYHLDASRTDRAVVRTLDEEIARVVRGRAANPRWIAGQIRHGHRGAAEIAETVDNLFAFAVLTDAVRTDQFDLVYDAVLGQESVRDFLMAVNPDAARGIIEKFDLAAARGFWVSRRNSIALQLAELREAVS